MSVLGLASSAFLRAGLGAAGGWRGSPVVAVLISLSAMRIAVGAVGACSFEEPPRVAIVHMRARHCSCCTPPPRRRTPPSACDFSAVSVLASLRSAAD